MPANEQGIKAKTIYKYQQKYAHYKKNSNSIQAADNPIWMLTSTKTCQKSTLLANESCSGNDLITTTFDYDYYNLQLKSVVVVAKNHAGANETRRTCYEYDKYGNRIGETLPKANLSSCN